MAMQVCASVAADLRTHQVQSSEDMINADLWFTPLACGPGSPELSKSYMDIASKLFTLHLPLLATVSGSIPHAAWVSNTIARDHLA